MSVRNGIGWAILLAGMLVLLSCAALSNRSRAESAASRLAAADSLYRKKEYAASATLYSEHVQRMQRNAALDDSTYGYPLFRLALCYNKLGDARPAAATFERAAQFRERIGANPEEIWKAWYNCGVNALDIPDHQLAIRALLSALDAVGDDSIHYARQVARARDQLGFAFDGVGDQVAAESCYVAVTTYVESKADSKWRGDYYYRLGDLYRRQSRFDRSEQLWMKCLRLREARADSSLRDYGLALNAVGSLYTDQYRYKQGEPFLRKALDVFAQIGLSSDSYDVSFILTNIGTIVQRRGEIDSAAALFEQALAIRASQFPPHAYDLRHSQAMLAACRTNQDRLSEADSLFRLVLELADSTATPQWRGSSADLTNFGILKSIQGDWDTAERLTLDAYRQEEARFRTRFDVMPEWDALNTGRSVRLTAGNLLSIRLRRATTDPTVTERLCSLALSTKGRITERMMQRARFSGYERDPELRSLHDSLAAARMDLARIWPMLEKQANDTTLAARAAHLANSKTRFEHEFARRFRIAVTDTAAWEVDASRIARSLGPGSAAVEYLKFDYREDNYRTTSRYLAVVLTRNGVSYHDLGAAADVDSLVAAYVRQFDTRSPDARAARAVARDLYRRLWAPFESRIAGDSLILVAPDAELLRVSFATLVDSAGLFLVERAAIHNITCLRDLTASSPVALLGSVDSFLALGDPRLDGLSADQQWPALPGTRAEIRAVTESLVAHGAQIIDTLFGAAATVGALRSRSDRASLIYLATHGFFRAVAGPGQDTTSSEAAIGTENPLLQAGLLFSAVDPASAAYEILTAEEIAAMRLERTRLVVLSACESGIGSTRIGEGAFDLRRAFQFAGARTVISALWRIPDRDTAELMSAVFDAQHGSLPFRLRDAQLRILQRRREQGESAHPLYWGGVVATGEWR